MSKENSDWKSKRIKELELAIKKETDTDKKEKLTKELLNLGF